MTHSREYGLFGCRINPLRDLLRVHSRSTKYPRLIPRPDVGD